MDIIKYQKDRDAELSEFKKEYTDLKVQYMRDLTDAIYEKDPEKQNELVQAVISTNTQLAQHVRDFLSKAGSKYDPAVTSQLTKDIIDYQNETRELNESKHKTDTMQNLLTKNQSELDTLKTNFNIFLGLLIVGILVVIFLIFKSSSNLSRFLPESLKPTTAI